MSDMQYVPENRIPESDVEGWAAERPFAELSADERAHVIATLGSSDAYGRLRSTIITARTVLHAERASLHPEPDTARSLHAALRVRTTARRWSAIGALFTARIPAYQALAGAAALLVVAFLVGRPDGPERIVEREIVQVPVHDTVYLTSDRAALTGDRLDTDVVEYDVLDSELVNAGIGDSERVATSRVFEQSDDDRRASARRASGRSAHAARREQGRMTIAATDASRAREERIRDPRVDSALRRASAARPDQLGGLGNLKIIAHQRRGVSLAEDTAYRRFAFSAP